MERKERRQFRRIKGKTRVIFKILRDKGEQVVEIFNMGGGGICIPLGVKVNPGTSLEIGVLLPGEDEPFYVFAEVCWQAEKYIKDECGKSYFETGIKFLRMEGEERKRLINYVYRTFDVNFRG